jgi:uncharacterized protein with GYD domain
MPQYLYQLAYTPESLAAQMKNPQDRLEVVGKQLAESAGVKIVGGGYSFGEYDIAVIVEAADDTTMAAVAIALAAGGAIKVARCPFHKYTASPCGLASFPRKRESRSRRHRDWMPAYAGMTFTGAGLTKWTSRTMSTGI